MLIILTLILCGLLGQTSADYKPTWDSIDSRPLPQWYDKAKVGIFLHWGIYSVPSYGNEWFWYRWKVDGLEGLVEFMEKNYPPDFSYQDFAPEFTAEFFDPEEWAKLFVSSGAKYVVLTSKHHEGFTLWPSKYAYSWNANDVGPRRNLVAELANAINKTDLHFGLYHSLFEWFHPLYLEDRENNWTTSNFVDLKIIPEMKELIDTYQPEILWSDGHGDAPDTYWKATEFLAWLYNESPVKDFILTNDRWGNNVKCKHGGFFTCSDRYIPGHLLSRKWENCMTLDTRSWAYRRNAASNEVMSIDALIATLAQTMSFGGNILINVPPTKEGTIIPIFQERLTQLGTWLNINGEAIYESAPWTSQNDTITPGIWYTSNNSTVYAIILDWPENNTLVLGSVVSLFDTPDTEVNLLGYGKTLYWQNVDEGVAVSFPDKAEVNSKWAWVLKISPVV